MSEPAPLKRACEQCPWRLSNQGKKHAYKFYTMANLKRLWNQIRRGGKPQGCHLTDPSHPDHVAAGCKPGAVARECPGSVLVVTREIKRMADENNVIGENAVPRYLAMRKRHGLTKTGIYYWLIERIKFANVPFFGAPGIPAVEEDPEIGLPEQLREG